MTHHAHPLSAEPAAPPAPVAPGAARPGHDTQDARPGRDMQERPMRPAMLRGWRRRCPSCGSGPLLRGYLKVRDACPVCGEELHHHRADDGPAYLTVLIVGHVLGPMMLWAFVAFRPDPLVLASIFSVASVAMCLFLLPRLKGALIGIQWSRRMYGFGDDAV